VFELSPASAGLSADPPIDISDYPVRGRSPSTKPSRSEPTSTGPGAPGDAGANFAAKVALVNLLGYLRALHTAGTFVMRRESAL
jgi:hypothetical protein